MTPQEIEARFTREDGYHFARWGRPIVPVVFGVEDETLGVVKSALDAICVIAGHSMAETDPELGVNLLIFFFRDWDELLAVPDLGQLIPDLPALVTRLKAAGASRYTGFRFEKSGEIRACIQLQRMDETVSDLPADVVALDLAVRAILDWAPGDETPFLEVDPKTDEVVLRPQVSALIKAAYDPVMPAVTDDKSHALRLFARVVTG